MDFPRIVIGYHGCPESRAHDLLSGKLSIADWPVSQKKWDWLGWGVYFWEFGPARAKEWANAKAKRDRVPCTVIAAVLQLGTNVLDLTDVRVKPLFEGVFRRLKLEYAAKHEALPVNDGEDPDRKRRVLDCTVIGKVCDTLTGATPPQPINAVRGAFEEGDAMFPGAMLKSQTHIQIAVRDPAKVILGVFKPMLL